ncbi:MAG: ParA family protein [Thermodesulfobacteriota bacterium]
MAIVGIVGNKGGTGKSTLARAILTEATRSGLQARLVDLDPQSTACDWARIRQRQGLEPEVDVQGVRSLADALKGSDGLDYLTVDCPGRASALTLELAKRSDLVVLPSGCAADDLRPVARLANELTAGGVPRARLVVALTRVGTAGEEVDARAFLEEASLACVPGSLPERAAYRIASNRGLSVAEVKVLSLRRRAEELVAEIGRLLE